MSYRIGENDIFIDELDINEGSTWEENHAGLEKIQLSTQTEKDKKKRNNKSNVSSKGSKSAGYKSFGLWGSTNILKINPIYDENIYEDPTPPPVLEIPQENSELITRRVNYPISLNIDDLVDLARKYSEKIDYIKKKLIEWKNFSITITVVSLVSMIALVQVLIHVYNINISTWNTPIEQMIVPDDYSYQINNPMLAFKQSIFIDEGVFMLALNSSTLPIETTSKSELIGIHINGKYNSKFGFSFGTNSMQNPTSETLPPLDRDGNIIDLYDGGGIWDDSKYITKSSCLTNSLGELNINALSGKYFLYPGMGSESAHIEAIVLIAEANVVVMSDSIKSKEWVNPNKNRNPDPNYNESLSGYRFFVNGSTVIDSIYERVSVTMTGSILVSGTLQAYFIDGRNTTIFFNEYEDVRIFDQKNPTSSPTVVPTLHPTPLPGRPTEQPTEAPTPFPTLFPTAAPTPIPSLFPTASPSHFPTLQPTPVPSLFPTEHPTANPSASPTLFPSPLPTLNPTYLPTENPTLSPSHFPTEPPVPLGVNETAAPTAQPTNNPTPNPSFFPTASPTPKPTVIPSQNPSLFPTPNPSFAPSPIPTIADPSEQPTLAPTGTPKSLGYGEMEIFSVENILFETHAINLDKYLILNEVEIVGLKLQPNGDVLIEDSLIISSDSVRVGLSLPTESTFDLERELSLGSDSGLGLLVVNNGIKIHNDGIVLNNASIDVLNNSVFIKELLNITGKGILVDRNGYLNITNDGILIQDDGLIMNGDMIIDGTSSTLLISSGGVTVNSDGITVNSSGISINSGGLLVTGGVDLNNFFLVTVLNVSTGGVVVYNDNVLVSFDDNNGELISISDGISIESNGLYINNQLGFGLQVNSATLYDSSIVINDGGMLVNDSVIVNIGGLNMNNSAIVIYNGGLSVLNCSVNISNDGGNVLSQGGVIVESFGVNVEGGGLKVQGGFLSNYSYFSPNYSGISLFNGDVFVKYDGITSQGIIASEMNITGIINVTNDGAYILSDGIVITKGGMTINDIGLSLLSGILNIDTINLNFGDIRVINSGINIISDDGIFISNNELVVNNGSLFLNNDATILIERDGVSITNGGILSSGIVSVNNDGMKLDSITIQNSTRNSIENDGVLVSNGGLTIISEGLNLLNTALVLRDGGMIINSGDITIKSGYFDVIYGDLALTSFDGNHFLDTKGSGIDISDLNIVTSGMQVLQNGMVVSSNKSVSNGIVNISSFGLELVDGMSINSEGIIASDLSIFHTGGIDILDNGLLINQGGLSISSDGLFLQPGVGLTINNDGLAIKTGGLIILDGGLITSTKVEITDGHVFVPDAIDINGIFNHVGPSDERLKTNITILSNSLEKISHLRGVFYDWEYFDNNNKLPIPNPFSINSNKHHVGLIAQEVQEIIPNIVHLIPNNYQFNNTLRNNLTNYLGLNMIDIIPYLIESIKELQFNMLNEEKLIDQLEEKVKQIEIEIELIKQYIVEYQQKLNYLTKFKIKRCMNIRN